MEIGQHKTDQLLRAALSGLAARQRVISDNVANVDTPGFKASRVYFERALQSAMGRDDDRPRVLMLANVNGSVAPPADSELDVKPAIVASLASSHRADGNNVDIDLEMVELAETNLTYNALAQIASTRLQLLRSIISEGAR
jgi:flagellar basal-body rod protein FlgB